MRGFLIKLTNNIYKSIINLYLYKIVLFYFYGKQRFYC